MTAIVQNGHKISIAIAASAAVAVAAIVADPPVALEAITGFFAFLGGLVMGKQL